MQKCSTCGVEKAFGCFYVRNVFKGTLHKQCKDCIQKTIKKYAENNRQQKAVYMRGYYRDTRGKHTRQKTWGTKWDGIRAWIRELKENNPCVDCGKKYLACVMDLDHVVGEKLLSIGQMMGQRVSDEDVLTEVQKCELVCSNCHRIRTWKRNNP
jgi:hypothetical protein